ncbi:calmodulin-binding protein 25-like [Primulina huaijiensis]|uniref:calmodulin-binding protein 25-like n=1 Tax=Primulina huaijiensis TaxID=1492673 RepID=UPI003CC7463F
MEQLWQMHPTFGDYLIQDIFTMETETLTKALQKPFVGNHPSYAEDLLSAEMVESLFSAPVPTPTASGGSENDTTFSRTRRSVAPSGRVTKRKSRATKRATVTFISADPSNFRQMVQQMTGGSFVRVDGNFPVSPVLKLEPCKPMNRLQPCGSLPTIDPSVFPMQDASAQLPPPPAPVADGGAPAAGLQFDSFGGFPTLESWKVM